MTCWEKWPGSEHVKWQTSEGISALNEDWSQKTHIESYNSRIWNATERVDLPEQNAETPHIRLVSEQLLQHSTRDTLTFYEEQKRDKKTS